MLSPFMEQYDSANSLGPYFASVETARSIMSHTTPWSESSCPGLTRHDSRWQKLIVPRIRIRLASPVRTNSHPHSLFPVHTDQHVDPWRPSLPRRQPRPSSASRSLSPATTAPSSASPTSTCCSSSGRSAASTSLRRGPRDARAPNCPCGSSHRGAHPADVRDAAAAVGGGFYLAAVRPRGEVIQY
jgi:hypothetical protein